MLVSVLLHGGQCIKGGSEGSAFKGLVVVTVVVTGTVVVVAAASTGGVVLNAIPATRKFIKLDIGLDAGLVVSDAVGA